MKLTSQFSRIYKSASELGPNQLGLYGLYQLGLRTGHYRRQLSTALARLNNLNRFAHIKLHPCLSGLPERNVLLELLGDHIHALYEEADEIVSGYVRLFGGQPVPLILTQPEPLEDWTKFELSNALINGQDIKSIWEPGRFGWACKLAMAYHLSNDEQYAASFWLYAERFLSSNPPYFGPHWSSAQEVAIRLVVLAFLVQVFTPSSQTTSERLELIAKAIAVHAERIPPTMVYARSQNNNHLIVEALGLFTASAALREHPLAPRWHKLGWDWLQYSFHTQIAPDGTYTQQSTNYHRLMLQAALWAFAVHEHAFINESLPPDTITRLEASTNWLWKLIDPETGRVPNLGHNDGAYFLPLTICPYHDYRPVIHTAAHAFLHTDLTPKGPWNDMACWLCSPADQLRIHAGLNVWHATPHRVGLNTEPPYLLQSNKNGSWATLRVATFHSRPAHADQLHLDLWWRGLNLAQDPGTYLYNSQPPWENALTSAFVHNTVVVDSQEFMQRSGRFLYLDWAQAKVIAARTAPDGHYESLTAEHNGYRKISVTHARKVTIDDDGRWEIIDHLDGSSGSIHTARLHWLLPDWEYEILAPSNKTGLLSYNIRFHSPYGLITLNVSVSSVQGNKNLIQTSNFQLVRAGMLLFGTGIVSPITGWTSPKYGDKIPALACILEVYQTLPIEFKSEWILPSES